MDKQGESSLSSNMSRKVAGSEGVKQEEPDQKKSKQDESDNTQEFQNEPTQKSMNDLPTEMLMKLLKYGDDDSLMNFRLVNRQWRVISTEILLSRGGIELQFSYDETKKMFVQWIKKKMGNRSLADFLECFNESKTCPYSSFLFRLDLNALKYEGKDWNSFLSKFGETLKCLKLVVYAGYRPSDLPEKLRDLLLNTTPNLEELGLTFSNDRIDPVALNLFSKKTTLSSKGQNSKKIDAPPVQLPRLKVLHLSEILFSKCPRIVDDLLKAAVNLKSIQDFGEHHSSWKKWLKTEDYVFLHRRGKLNLLEEAKMIPSVKLFSAFKGNPHAFKLKRLTLDMVPMYNEPNNWADASTFISELFENNKDTLRELTIDPIGFLPDVKFPKFTKLARFTVDDTKESEILEPVFPSGIHTLDVFPALRTLDFDADWTQNFPQDENIPRLPSVRNLRVHDSNLKGDCIVKIMTMCPNLEFFKISLSYGKDTMNFPEIGRQIWTHMKKLQYLDLQINLNSDFNTFHSLDSCFTGISIENCKRLYELMEAQKTLKRWKCQVKIPKSEFKTPVRENVSILDLKDLTELKVQLYWNVGDRDSTENLLERALTCVSEKYGFELMDIYFTIDQDVDF